MLKIYKFGLTFTFLPTSFYSQTSGFVVSRLIFISWVLEEQFFKLIRPYFLHGFHVHQHSFHTSNFLFIDVLFLDLFLIGQIMSFSFIRKGAVLMYFLILGICKNIFKTYYDVFKHVQQTGWMYNFRIMPLCRKIFCRCLPISLCHLMLLRTKALFR